MRTRANFSINFHGGVRSAGGREEVENIETQRHGEHRERGTIGCDGRPSSKTDDFGTMKTIHGVSSSTSLCDPPCFKVFLAILKTKPGQRWDFEDLSASYLKKIKIIRWHSWIIPLVGFWRNELKSKDIVHSALSRGKTDVPAVSCFGFRSASATANLSHQTECSRR